MSDVIDRACQHVDETLELRILKHINRPVGVSAFECEDCGEVIPVERRMKITGGVCEMTRYHDLTTKNFDCIVSNHQLCIDISVFMPVIEENDIVILREYKGVRVKTFIVNSVIRDDVSCDYSYGNIRYELKLLSPNFFFREGE
ncbi:hypothetical protein [Photorhabdus luminescens]|uniref:hypothetical protein n=1 Tax=Photorhabdus luminescens TaxID=29488 RepID=UPI00159EEE55|nr:hypothetical protein [Photorhabdus luminescens]